MSQHKEQQGFVTIAQNNSNTDYLELARIQAASIKATQKMNRYAVIVDSTTKQQITEQDNNLFDYVIELPMDLAKTQSWKLANEPQVFWLTPFKETVKLEADLLFTRSIDHWWRAFRFRDIMLSTGCRNYLQQISTARNYRHMFDSNGLPDVYNGLMYFRYTKTAHDFFSLAQQIQQAWPALQNTLKNCRESEPSTDVLYAVTAAVLGQEKCTAPSFDFVNFVHMKSAHNGLPEGEKFTDQLFTEFDRGMIRINHLSQIQPLHYHAKDFVTEQMKEWYGSRNSSSS